MASKASCSHHSPMTMETAKENKFEKYDVFLSHRGPDTKTGFVGYLYEDLERHGLQPYLDCESIRIGEECWNSIEDGIKNTPIAVVVFSERYAESEWCLKELHVMLEAHPHKEILPVFYNVTPWDLRNPERGQFKDGFQKLEKKFDSNLIDQWKRNLEVASKLMGWEHSDKSTRSLEVVLVAKVVKRVLELANKSLPLDVGEHVVGVKEVAVKLIQCQLFEKEVSVLGLWGMGGIGKSTLAKELYNQLCKRFEASCYVEDVTEKLMPSHGVVEIQKQLLKDLCSSEIDKHNKSELKPILEERLSKKKILVVLDDVSNVDMLNSIMTRKMLKKGSVCIVTSRDKRVLESSNIFEPIEQEVYVHHVKMLNPEDSKRVFTSFAFGRDREMRPKYEALMTEISELCCGVPLVLKIYGCLLNREVDLDLWEDVKSKLNSGGTLDDTKILNCLRISYDSLTEKEKKMFLDIACALLGESEDMGICVWRSQNWQPRLGVRNLKKKALISVDERGRFTMHDHLRDMGREIERVEAGYNTRRLWMPMSLSFLEERKALPHSLQTLVIEHSKPHMILDLSDMKELRILICNNKVILISIPQNLHCLRYAGNDFTIDSLLRPNIPEAPEKAISGFTAKHYNLRYLELYWCDSLRSCPGVGHLFALEELSFNRCSNLEELPNLQQLTRLRKLKIGWCGSIVAVPGLGNLVALEDLSFGQCSDLKELPNLQQLMRLRKLDIDGCKSIVAVPGLGNLVALEELSFNSCSDLKELPNLQQLTRLRKLNISWCGSIVAVRGLGNLLALEDLSFFKCSNLKELPNLQQLMRLRELNIRWCDSIVAVPGLGNLVALEELSFGRCLNLKELPNLQQLTRLQKLDINGCKSIVAVPGLGDLVALEELFFGFCSNLKELPNLQQLMHLRKLHINGCKSIVAVPDLGNLVALVEFIAFGCHSLVALPNMHKLTNLQTLDLSRSSSLKEVPGLSELIALQTLEIEHEALQDGFNPQKLNKLVNLHVWNWCGPPAFSDVVSLEDLEIWESGEGIEMMPNLLNLARLQRVEIISCSFEDVSCLGNLISLRSISISGCYSLERLPDMHKLTRLEKLEVYSCGNIVVWAGVSISKSSDAPWVDQPRIGTGMALHTLELQDVGCRELPDLSLFPELKELTIKFCRSLERLISTMPMTALEWLEIEFCNKMQEVPDLSLFPKLKELTISHCWSLERLISTMPMTALEWLEIRSCNEMQEVPYLSQCRLLRHCWIKCCGKISLTMDEIMKLEAMCPGLDIDLPHIWKRRKTIGPIDRAFEAGDLHL